MYACHGPRATLAVLSLGWHPRRMRHLVLAAPLLLAACATPQQSARVPQINVDLLRSATQTLSSDADEGRAPTTPGEEKTVAFLTAAMGRAGLKPGNGGSWTQDVALAENTATPSALRITGGRAPLTLRYREDFVANTYRLENRTALADSELVFVGYGINAPERGWNDYAGVDVKGKTVVILVNDPDWHTPTVGGQFNGRAMTYYGRWTYKYEEAARQGAAGALIVHDTEPAAYGWGVVTSSWTGPQYNFDAADNHSDQSAAIGWLTKDAARRVLADGGQNLDRLSEAAARPGFRAVPLRNRATVSLTNQIKRAASKNVIGVLPGKTRPDEYVLYTAHWDHLGRCDADPDGDDICNGALDNATGTAGLLALAEAHAKAGAADRTLVFLAVTAEESGLLGSRYYGENPIFPLAKTVGGVNMDGLNITGLSRDLVVVGPGKSELEDYFARAARDLGATIKPEPTPEKGYYYRSDHFSLARFGVPMIYAESGEDLANGGIAAGRRAAEDYTVNRYHKPGDEYRADWDWSGAVRDLGIYYRIGRELADGSAWPNWREGDEFRAIRDRSRASVASR